MKTNVIIYLSEEMDFQLFTNITNVFEKHFNIKILLQRTENEIIRNNSVFSDYKILNSELRHILILFEYLNDKYKK